MTKMWIYRVRLSSGAFVDLPFPGISPALAKQVAEAQYGSGNILGYLGEQRQ
jgi:hypothetical protein